MIINFKTVGNKNFDIDLDPNETVFEVKKKVEIELGHNYPADQQLLIHKGKVLIDHETLNASEVNESSFLVVMAKKPRPNTKAGNQITSNAMNEDSKQKPPINAVSSEDQSSSVLLLNEEVKKNITQLVEMGFPEDKVILAMKAAFNNADRAVEYLTNGFPSEVEVALTAADGNNVETSELETVENNNERTSQLNTTPLNMFGGSNQSRSLSSGSLDFLRNNPQFTALRQVVQQNPSILQPMLQELGRTSPQLMQIIQNNQANFLRMVSDYDANSDSINDEDSLVGDLLGNSEGIEIQLTEAEAAAVERLESMGFDRNLVIEAFLACDRDEELAANYLLENSAEDS